MSNTSRSTSPSMATMRHAIEHSHLPGCLLDTNLRIVYVNQAWNDFARANDGSGATSEHVIGKLFLHFVKGAKLRQLYADLFATAQTTGLVWPFDFECSSPTQRRLHRMEVYPLAAGGFAVTYADVQSEAQSPSGSTPDSHKYLDPRSNLISMCSNCRKTRRRKPPEVWDWVPDHLTDPFRMRTSHGICRACWSFYYPQVYARLFLEPANELLDRQA